MSSIGAAGAYLLDGAPAEADAIAHLATVNYGHFSTMQVRNGAVRGLGLHLKRLQGAHRELFGSDIDVTAIRALLRQAAGQAPNSYLRVTLFEHPTGVTRALVVVRPPQEPNALPQRLVPVRSLRPAPHIKHVGSFAQILWAQQAAAAGYDDALLVADGDEIAETTIANIGFATGDKVVWPTAPALNGITKQLLTGALLAAGRSVVERPVRLSELDEFDAAFLTNSVGIEAVGAIGAVSLPADGAMTAELRHVYAALPWDEL